MARMEEKQIAAQIVIAYINNPKTNVNALFYETQVKGQPQIEELWSRVIKSVAED